MIRIQNICCLLFIFLLASSLNAADASISGKVVDASGAGLEGVMVSAVDDENRKWISVFSQKDGSFTISGLRAVDHKVRTRLMGLSDEWRSVVKAGTQDLLIETNKVGEDTHLAYLDPHLLSDPLWCRVGVCGLGR